MIGLGSEFVDDDDDVGVVVDDDVDVVFADFDSSPTLLVEPEDAGVMTRELLGGDSVLRLLPLTPLRLSSSSLASSSTVVADVDNDDTFDDSDDRPLLSCWCWSPPPLTADNESVTLISTEPDRDLDPSRSPPDSGRNPLKGDTDFPSLSLPLPAESSLLPQLLPSPDFPLEDDLPAPEVVGSAPIWLQVFASSANGLDFASSCKQMEALIRW